MFLTVVISVALVLLTTVFHFTVLRTLSGRMSDVVMADSLRILVMVFVAFAAHIVEIGLYAGAYGLSAYWGLGQFGGAPVTAPIDYFYFSIVSFTTLGLGDVFPDGHLRLITGVEALNGLLLIAWTGSFIFVAMSRFWPWRECAQPVGRAVVSDK